MNKIGVSSGFYGRDWPVEFTASIRKAAGLGFDAIELFTAGMLNQSKPKLKDYAKLAEELGIELQYCAGLTPDVDPASKDESVRRQGVEHLKRTLELIGLLKGRIFGGVNYIAWGSRPEDIREKPAYRERSIRSLREVLPVAAGFGITYCVEATNRFEQFLLNTADEGNAFVEEVGSPNLKLTLDTFHLSIEEDNIAEALLRAGNNLGHMHLGEHNRHYPGKGFMPWDDIFRALGKLKYKGTLGMEPFIIPGGDVGQGCAVWNDRTGGASEAELDELARRSIEFVRNRVYFMIECKVQSHA